MSAYNGSGTFLISGSGLPYVTGTTISSTVVNQLNSDLATGLSTAICKDGQTTITANLPMSGFKHTGAAAATASGEYLVYGQGEGTFSPTLFGATTAGTPTYVAQRGNYMKIGTTVFVWGSLIATLSGASGILTVGNFPYAQDNTTNDIGSLALPYWGLLTLDSGYVTVGLVMVQNTTTAQFYESGSGHSAQQLGQSALGSNQLSIAFVGQYTAAS